MRPLEFIVHNYTNKFKQNIISKSNNFTRDTVYFTRAINSVTQTITSSSCSDRSLTVLNRGSYTRAILEDKNLWLAVITNRGENG
jgi:tRNA(Phe) wybutosine-synthesizing methylase Tyw3